MPIKVVIADDHEVVRRGLVSLLAGSEVKIVGEAASGDEAVKVTKKLKPDVVLLDIRMQGKDGLAALEKIRGEMPNVRCVMLSTFDNPTYVARAVAAGAHHSFGSFDLHVHREAHALLGGRLGEARHGGVGG